jgi:hypothetical protein
MRWIVFFSFALLAFIPQPGNAGPVDVKTETVSEASMQVSFVWKSKRLWLRFSNGRDDAISCKMGVSAMPPKELRIFAGFVRELAEGVEDHPDADWGRAKTGMAALAGSNAVGFCNAAGVTREGKIYIQWVYNRACFGSAGCNTDEIILTGSPDFFLRLATKMDEAAALKPKI